MEKISTLFLRRELTRVIDRLVAGESFIVTHRGKTLAFLQPVTIIGDKEGRVTAMFTQRDAEPVDAVQTGQTGKITPSRAASKQTLRDEILRGVRTGKRE